jgi:hypothetical protein
MLAQDDQQASRFTRPAPLEIAKCASGFLRVELGGRRVRAYARLGAGANGGGLSRAVRTGRLRPAASRQPLPNEARASGRCDPQVGALGETARLRVRDLLVDGAGVGEKEMLSGLAVLVDRRMTVAEDGR